MRYLVIIIALLTNINLYPQNFWVQTNGPYSARAMSIICKKSNNYLFAGTNVGGGVYRSTDNGNTWVKKSDGLEPTDARSFTITPNGEIYTGFYSLSGETRVSVYKSTNNGNNWTATGLDSMAIKYLASNSLGHIFAGTINRGLWRSTDNGLTWQQVYNVGYYYSRGLVINKTGTIFFGNDIRILKSTDNGGTWSIISGIAGGGGEMALDSTNNVYIENSRGVFKSPGDSNWAKICDSTLVSSISISPAGHILLGMNTGAICKSTNGGTSWFTYYYCGGVNSNPPNLTCMTFNNSNHLFASLDYLGLVRTTNDGTSWTRINYGLTNANMNQVAIRTDGRIFAGTWNDGIFFSTNMGNNWSGPSLLNQYIMAIGINTAGTVFASYTNSGGVLYHSTNGGVNWSVISYNFPNGWGNEFLCNNLGHLFICTNMGGIHRSTDGGVNWQLTGLYGTYALDLMIAHDNSIWACANGLYRSTNEGSNWMRIDSATFPWNISSITELPNGKLLLSANQKLYVSSNGGTNWAIVWNEPISRLITNKTGHVFGTGYEGVYRSTNEGQNWTQINSGLFNKNINSLALDSNGFLYAATSGSGVFRSYYTTVGITSNTKDLPTEFSLTQNYPNPFNPATKIKFDIPTSRGTRGVTQLIIYDVLGKEIATPVNEQLNPGTYEIEWDGSNYPSGVYFYKLITNDYSETKKMVLIK
jgi:photosystem II stability/assembly factor-like uncharacterized protein